jgi:hypothetical protein
MRRRVPLAIGASVSDAAHTGVLLCTPCNIPGSQCGVEDDSVRQCYYIVDDI